MNMDTNYVGVHVVAKRKVVKVCWVGFGLKVAKEKVAQRDKNIELGEDGHKIIK
jgi:hypothetical protein